MQNNPLPSSAERTNELIASGQFRGDSRVLQLMVEYQDQLVAILEDCTESDDGKSNKQKDRFVAQVYHAAEAFNMMTLATIHVFTEKSKENPDVKKMFASILTAGLKAAITEAMVSHCKNPQDFLATMKEIDERANGFQLKMLIQDRRR